MAHAQQWNDSAAAPAGPGRADPPRKDESMRKITLLAALAAVLAAPTLSWAYGPRYDQYGFRQRWATRAAPWFLYWPYESYWQTPAPTGYLPTYGPMTIGPAAGQIGPAAGPAPMPRYPGPTGYDY
jgi:hypothetical protein